MSYCVDTSALIAAWQERYPQENFPKFWDRLDSLVREGKLIAPMEVFLETKRRSDELHAWLKDRKTEMFLEIDDDVQEEAAKVLERFPRLVGLKSRTPLPIRSLSPSRGFGVFRSSQRKSQPGMTASPISRTCAHFSGSSVKTSSI